MKYEVTPWTREGKRTAYTVGPPSPNKVMRADVLHTFVAEFPVNPPGDLEREERARMLAHKVCAFLNELEEKKAQITELMNIAGQ